MLRSAAPMASSVLRRAASTTPPPPPTTHNFGDVKLAADAAEGAQIEAFFFFFPFCCLQSSV